MWDYLDWMPAGCLAWMEDDRGWSGLDSGRMLWIEWTEVDGIRGRGTLDMPTFECCHGWRGKSASPFQTSGSVRNGWDRYDT